MRINVNLDEVVGLVLEFAEYHHIKIEAVKKMNDEYDVGTPTVEERIQFLRGILPLLPVNSYLIDIVKDYLVAVDNGEKEEPNSVITKVSDYLLENGGLVTVYRVESTIVDKFFIATFDDGDDEMLWGCDITAGGALRSAEREWNHYNPSEGPDENPFTEALEHVQS